MELIDRKKLNKKKKYLFKTEYGAFPRSDWFFRYSDVMQAEVVDSVPREEYERVCKERDAAVSDLVMCMHFSTKNNNVCNFCNKDMAEYPNKCAGWYDSCECNPEWRGASKDEDDGQSIL